MRGFLSLLGRPVLARFVAALQPELRALQGELEAMRAELGAVRRELEADRVTFQHANEQIRQTNELARQDQHRHLEQMRAVYGDLNLTRLMGTLESALLTLAIGDDPAPYISSSEHTDSA